VATTAQTATVNPATEAGRAQPQTTVEPPGGPFIRHTQEGRRSLYNASGIQFGGLVTQPLPATPGYIRRFRVHISATGGVNGTTTVATTPDAPFNCVSLLQLKDPFGTTLFAGPGYEMLYLVPLFSGGYGLLSAADIRNMPSYVAPSVGTSGTGDFTFATALPLEMAMGYGVLSGANASLQSTINWQFATSSTVYSTAPGTLPTLNLAVDSDFYWLPQGVNVEPPGLGTSRQWVLQTASPPIGSNATAMVQFPRSGGYLDTIILIMRDSTGARIDAWPQQLQLIVDGVTLIDSRIDEIYDDMYNTFAGVTRPTGVLAFSRKTSLNQVNLGLLDTGEKYLSTTPGTLLEVNGAPWGSITNAPATLSVIFGQIVPSGNLIQGLPEV